MKYPLHVHYKMRPGRFGVLKALDGWESQEEHPPTLTALAEILGCSKQCVHQHLKRLVADGFVGREGYSLCQYVTTNKGRKHLREAANETD